MSYKMNGELRQAKQYRRLAKEMDVKSKRSRAVELPQNIAANGRAVAVSEESESNAPTHVEGDRTSVSNWAWEPSEHDGLLTYHDSRKRWYHCMKCEYFNDRLYHSKMHYERIHVKNGKSMPRKRKYPNSSNVSVTKDTPIPKAAISKNAHRTPSRNSVSTTLRGSPTKKYQTKNADDSTPSSSKSADSWKSPNDMLTATDANDGKWNHANAKILTFGDGSYTQKAGPNCIGSGLSLNVLDLKAPAAEKKPSDARSESVNEDCEDEDDDELEDCDDVSSVSDQENLSPSLRGARNSRRNNVHFYVMPSSSAPPTSLPASHAKSGPAIAMRRVRTSPSSRSAIERDEEADNHESDALSPVRRDKYTISNQDSYTDDEPEDGSRFSKRANQAHPPPPSKSPAKLLSPANSPQIMHNVLRPRTDNSITATPMDAPNCRLTMLMGTPREDEYILRTPMRPSEMMSTPNFGTSPDGRQIRPHALTGGVSCRDGAHPFVSEVDSKLVTPVWDTLVCTESIEPCQIFAGDDVAMYDWNATLPP